MIINRTDFLQAVAFLKPAIYKNNLDMPDPIKHLHVKPFATERKLILTSTNRRVIKRVTLFRAPQLENMIIPKEERFELSNDEYLIDPNVLEGFEKLCQKHKGKLKEKIKTDPSCNFIEISSSILESCDIDVNHHQIEGAKYPNVDRLFEGCPGSSDVYLFDHELLIAGLKEFSNSSGVKIYTGGMNEPLYMEQDEDHIYFQSVVMALQQGNG